MLLGQLALVAAALFTGAAFYVNAVEQPARLGLDDAALLAEWKPSYRRAAVMQVSLAALAVLLGFAAWLRIDGAGWIVGALLILANLPVTLRLIMPLNRRLMATEPPQAGPETRALILRWAGLHSIRTALGIAAVVAFVIASVT